MNDYLASLRSDSHLSDEEFREWCTEASTSYDRTPEFVCEFARAIRKQTEEEWLTELRPVFEAAARTDQSLVEYHGRRLGVELLPLHGRVIR